MTAIRPTPYPAPPSQTEAVGIFQGDLIIRTALIEALNDLRAYPQQLDYAFASLLRDDLTSRTYGTKERDQAREWFLRTEIPVVLDNRLDSVPGTCLSITVLDSSEAEATLADVHYLPAEAGEIAWPVLAGPFDAVGYDPATGVLTLPDSNTLIPAPGMVAVDRLGGRHPLLEVLDRVTVVIEPRANADFRGVAIRSAYPRSVVGVESVEFREIYRVGINVHGDRVRLTWLHSIVLFALLARRQDLLEARGFGRVQLSAGPPAHNDLYQVENMWSRFVDITGYTKQVWPKFPRERILSATTAPFLVSPVNETATVFVPEPGVDADDAEWLAAANPKPV